MRPARRADPPHRPDHSKKPRSPLQSPSPDRLPDPSAGAQSFTHSDTDISLPPIASYPTPQLGSKMTKARTAAVLACAIFAIVYNMYTMSFIRRIRRAGRVYLAEVQNHWINGKCVQRHIRYVGREADGKTLLAASLSEVEVEQVKLYGPLLVLNHLANKIQLAEQLGDYSQAILSLVYAHCLDYRSLNYMPAWLERTDLNFLLHLDRKST